MGSTTTTGTCELCRREEIRLRTFEGRKVCSSCGVAAGFVRNHPEIIRQMMHDLHGEDLAPSTLPTPSTPSTGCERCEEKEALLAEVNAAMEEVLAILCPAGGQTIPEAVEALVTRASELDRLYNEAQEECVGLHRQLKAATGQAPRTGMAGCIEAACLGVFDFLLAKNAAYGNSAADPVRIFSKADPLEQINVRIDDKLSRMMRGNEYPGDDDELDLLGYLLLKRAVRLHHAEMEREAA